MILVSFDLVSMLRNLCFYYVMYFMCKESGYSLQISVRIKTRSRSFCAGMLILYRLEVISMAFYG
jgi:hypothetical protein